AEQDVFSQLEEICKSNGYIYAVASLCFRDNFLVTSPGRSIAENFSHWFSKNKLCKNEINTLLGLMVKKPLTKLAITQEEIDKLANDSDSLLEELHNSMLFNPSAIEALFSD
ncbi:prepilin peptidase, partial [Vibrio cholerae]|nr:prepilin peptidase [Vibrio cholerae]